MTTPLTCTYCGHVFAEGRTETCVDSMGNKDCPVIAELVDEDFAEVKGRGDAV